MKKMSIVLGLLSCTLLTSPALSKQSCDSDCNNQKDCLNDCFRGLRTAVHYRSQGANTARELVGWQWEINRPDMCENYGATYLAFEYQRSFKECEIAEALFGSPTLCFAGSSVEDRQPGELLADNFGLPTDFRGSITFNPRIENYIVDFGLYVGLDYYLEGLYLLFHAPFAHARWTLDTNGGNCQDIEVPATNEDGSRKMFPDCYMGSATKGEDNTLIPVKAADGIKQALSGRFRFGDMQTDWCSGMADFCRRTRNGLADIDVIVGYNVLNDDCYHFGFLAMAVMPTGKKRKNLFILDPVVGNGKHFELGGGISAHTVLWAGEDSNIALFLMGNITHMFKSRQCRTFDLVDNGPLSRYMLLKEYDTNGTTYTYNGRLISANCFTRREVDVSLFIKADFSLKLAYRWCGLGVDVGYNIYGHSNEKIELRCDACPSDIERRNFAIKGTEPVCCDQYTIALIPNDDDPDPTVFPNGTSFPPDASAPENCPDLDPISKVVTAPSNANQSGATAFRPGMPQNGTLSDEACNVCLNEGTVTDTNGTPVADLTTEDGFFIDNGLQPRLLSTKDLDICSGEAHSVITHKLFTFVNYTWMDECGWNPNLGIGFEVEFDGNHNRSSCERAGLNQWGVLIKGGISF